MASRRSRLASCGMVILLLCLYFTIQVLRDMTHGVIFKAVEMSKQQHHPSQDTQQTLTLTRRQCDTEFPRLTKSIDDIIAEGPFQLKNTGESGPLQGRIIDGKASSGP